MNYKQSIYTLLWLSFAAGLLIGWFVTSSYKDVTQVGCPPEDAYFLTEQCPGCETEPAFVPKGFFDERLNWASQQEIDDALDDYDNVGTRHERIENMTYEWRTPDF